MDLSGFQQIFTAEGLTALVTLSLLEIVLGIDNVIFISILCGKLPPEQRDRARIMGLSLAMFMRIGLLFAITWVMGLDKTILFTLPIVDQAISGKSLILLLGGLFLVGKSTLEIHHKIDTGGPVEAVPKDKSGGGKLAKSAYSGFRMVIAQILALDLVFSLDSVITAAGMTDKLPIMIVAVVLAVIVMLVFSGFIARFVDKHPTIKMLALSFLILIGVMLVAEAFHQSIPKGYIYFAMAFSLGVEMLNLWVRSRTGNSRHKPTPESDIALGGTPL